MLDGIDGSGKDTINDAWKKFLEDENKKIFDLKKYWIENKKYPELDEIKYFDFILSAEPTYVGMGMIIREELIKNGRDYPPEAIANAFSLDRLILYKKIIAPLIDMGKTVIQVRGISSSLAYQSTQHTELTLGKLSRMPGNEFALKYRPDHLVLMDISLTETLTRLALRQDKKDDAIFEKSEFLKKLITKYESEEFEKIFTSRGTTMHRLSAEEKIDIMKANGINLLKSILTL